MRCIRCGSDQPEGAAFCANCGQPLEPAGDTWPREPDAPLETCEIQREKVSGSLTKGDRLKFYANAVGPHGRYTAAESPEFWYTGFSFTEGTREVEDLRLPKDIPAEVTAALDALINQLVRDGWASVETRGSFWYSHRFRRRATAGVAASMPTPMAQPAASPAAVPPASPAASGERKSAAVAYALWLVLGLVGAHRYYLGRTGTGLLQTLTLGGAGLWWFVDLFMLRDMIKQANGTN